MIKVVSNHIHVLITIQLWKARVSVAASLGALHQQYGFGTVLRVIPSSALCRCVVSMRKRFHKCYLFVCLEIFMRLTIST